MHGITEALDDCASWSGLRMNQQKTQLFHAGVNLTESQALARYGFSKGTLPVRYLGLPLMHRKLRVSEYEPLLDKITKLCRAWSVKTLSFSGRRQLIGSVITGLVNFWISTFLLPKSCIKRIESLCSRFLWSGNVDSWRGTKVSWASVCLPKEEGGLGLRKLSIWNKTLCMRFIWLLFSDNNSLWAKWQKHYIIGTKSFSEIEVSTIHSSLWKSILQLRPLAAIFLRTNVADGRNTQFWWDSWTPFGPLIQYLGYSGPSRLRHPLNASVAAGWLLLSWLVAPMSKV